MVTGGAPVTSNQDALWTGAIDSDLSRDRVTLPTPSLGKRFQVPPIAMPAQGSALTDAGCDIRVRIQMLLLNSLSWGVGTMLQLTLVDVQG